MTEKEKVQIRILDEIYEYDRGTSLEAVSRDFQSRFPTGSFWRGLTEDCGSFAER